MKLSSLILIAINVLLSFTTADNSSWFGWIRNQDSSPDEEDGITMTTEEAIGTEQTDTAVESDYHGGIDNQQIGKTEDTMILESVAEVEAILISAGTSFENLEIDFRQERATALNKNSRTTESKARCGLDENMKICSNKFVEKESYMSSDAELAPFKRQGKRQSSEISAGTPSQTTKATGDTSEAKNADSPKLSWEHTSRSPYNQHDPHEMIMEVEVKQSIEQDVRDVIDPRNVGKIVTLLMELDWRYPTEYCIGGEAERGLCTGNYSRWSFYKDDGVCKPFEYGGCLGTLNMFLSENDCMDTCIRTPLARIEVELNRINGNDDAEAEPMMI